MVRTARETLKSPYAIIKITNGYIRLAFLTRVTKFSRASVFSSINNIVYISLKPQFGTIAGDTQYDLETFFARHLGDANLHQVKEWYDGYSFMGNCVYNAFDILFFLYNEIFKSYWFKIATPAFLVKRLKLQQFFLPDLISVKAGEELLSAFDINAISPITLLFQSGYLPIKDVLWEWAMNECALDFPNLDFSVAFTIP